MDSGGDALCNDEPPPSFHDALLARTYVPVVGPRSEGSPANTVIACHHNSVRLATGKGLFHSVVFFFFRS